MTDELKRLTEQCAHLESRITRLERELAVVKLHMRAQSQRELVRAHMEPDDD